MFRQICSSIDFLLRCRSKEKIQLHITISLLLDQLHQSSQEQDTRSFDASFLDFSPIDESNLFRSLGQTHQMRKDRYQRIDAHTPCHQNHLLEFIDIYTWWWPYETTSRTNDNLFIQDFRFRFPQPLSRRIGGFLDRELEVGWSLGGGFALV